MVAVPDDFLRTVVFLCVDEPGDSGIIRPVPKATGFFVRVPLESHPSASVDYLVTARHCIEEAMGAGTLYVRWNRKDGPFIDVPTRCSDWHVHDTADVATLLLLPNVLPQGMKQIDWDTASLSMDTFVGPGPSYKYEGTAKSEIGPLEVTVQPGVGYETYFLGLFTPHSGDERNLPVARFGHISRMPSELSIERSYGRVEMVAYLMEFQSWGGHSGSPVFFLHPLVVEDGAPFGEQRLITNVNYVHVSGFMGLVSGHYSIPKKAQLGEIQTDLNSGIAFVTPAEAVRQLLMREDLLMQRKQLADKIGKGRPTI